MISASTAEIFAGAHGGESGELHCKLGPAVPIEPGLRPQSPKNGSFSNVRRRLSAISLRECPKPEPGDWWPIRKSPPLAGLSASIRDNFSKRRTAWLGREDSNLRMVESKSGRTFNKIKARSELSEKFGLIRINRLAGDSEWKGLPGFTPRDTLRSVMYRRTR